MLLWEFVHSTFCLDGFVDYYSNRAIRPNLFASPPNRYRGSCLKLIGKTPTGWTYGVAHRCHWFVETSAWFFLGSTEAGRSL